MWRFPETVGSLHVAAGCNGMGLSTSCLDNKEEMNELVIRTKIINRHVAAILEKQNKVCRQ